MSGATGDTNSIKNMARSALLRLTNPDLIFPANRGKGRTVAPTDVKTILVVRPDHLGDLLFATPALSRLRLAFPDARITALVGPWGRPMWEGNPDIDHIEVVQFPGIADRDGGSTLSPYRLLRTEAGRLEKEQHDLGIVLRFDHWWGAALLAASEVPYRWGYDTPGMGSWLTNPVRYSPGRHEVEQNLTLVEQVIAAHATPEARERIGPLVVNRVTGTPPLRPPASEPPLPERLGHWPEARRRAVIHPGTSSPNKLWTVDGWVRVVRHLLGAGWTVAITGSAYERRLAEAIITPVQARAAERGVLPERARSLVNLAGETANLAQLVWVFEQSELVLGVDSGPMHIAAALDKPTLHLYGPSDETIWGPWGDPDRHRVLRAPGTASTGLLMPSAPDSAPLQGGPEMRAITPDAVLNEVRYLLTLCEQDRTRA
jgi:heptosyltransferase-2/heptosyltransferase-3